MTDKESYVAPEPPHVGDTSTGDDYSVWMDYSNPSAPANEHVPEDALNKERPAGSESTSGPKKRVRWFRNKE